MIYVEWIKKAPIIEVNERPQDDVIMSSLLMTLKQYTGLKNDEDLDRYVENYIKMESEDFNAMDIGKSGKRTKTRKRKGSKKKDKEDKSSKKKGSKKKDKEGKGSKKKDKEGKGSNKKDGTRKNKGSKKNKQN